MSRVGDNIKRARMDAGMTQKALGKKLGVSESFINEIELGRKVIGEALIEKVSKILNKSLNDISMSVEIESMEEVFEQPKPKTQIKKTGANSAPASDIWSGAFASVLKNIPVYDYSLTNTLDTKLLPIQNNKIDGFPQDKVFYLQIEDDDLMGFRIFKGDLAFAHYVNEVENNCFYLINHNEGKIIRQVKKIDSMKVLLISNRGSLITETVNIKDLKVVAKLERIEFKL